jgi:hypothetical protein
LNIAETFRKQNAGKEEKEERLIKKKANAKSKALAERDAVALLVWAGRMDHGGRLTNKMMVTYLADNNIEKPAVRKPNNRKELLLFLGALYRGEAEGGKKNSAEDIQQAARDFVVAEVGRKPLPGPGQRREGGGRRRARRRRGRRQRGRRGGEDRGHDGGSVSDPPLLEDDSDEEASMAEMEMSSDSDGYVMAHATARRSPRRPTRPLTRKKS